MFVTFECEFNRLKIDLNSEFIKLLAYNDLT